jgi:hypothetical protein
MIDRLNLCRCIASAALAAGALLTASFAQAQNLVQNPDFFDGLTGYATTADSDQNVIARNFLGGPTSPTEDGNNSAEGFLSETGAPSMISQSLTTTPGTIYLVTFAYAVEPGLTDSFTATFGNQTRTFTSSVSDGDTPFDIASFTARSTSAKTALTFTGTEGAFAVSDLDVEAGPAPVTGGGVLSFCLIAAGLAVRHFRRRALVVS